MSLDLPELRNRQVTYRLEIQRKLPARPGVNDYIHTAQRLGLRLAVASSSSRARLEGYLRQLALFGIGTDATKLYFSLPAPKTTNSHPSSVKSRGRTN